MKSIFLSILCFISLSLFWACANSEKDRPTPEETEAWIRYEYSSEDFVNPERGFYKYSEARSSNYQVLSVNALKNYRNGTTPNGATYRTVNSLVFRYYIMSDFVNSPISAEYLENMQRDFDAAREAGVKVIPRFTYTTTATPGDCPEDFICPPYGDAPKEIVLQHIGQLAPVLTENVDVILTVQMGFIGTWGENYYTDYFGDASPNADQGKLLDENWTDRIEVLQALLDGLPEELMVQVRYPQMKQRAIYGINAPTNVAPLTLEEAFSGTDKARIAFHNDCLFASRDDFGTYADYGNSSSPRRTDITNLKKYFAEDGKYLVIGGETCSDGYSPMNNCAPEGIANEDLRYLHYTYLNADYNNQVNNDWVDGGCMPAIQMNLGYRIQLDSALLPERLNTGDQLETSLFLTNVGYASPVKERPVQLILRETNTGAEHKLAFDTDVRFWFDAVPLTASFDLPASITAGTYDLFLFLPDGHASIADRPEFAIRLANEGTWQEETGYNSLNHQLEIVE